MYMPAKASQSFSKYCYIQDACNILKYKKRELTHFLIENFTKAMTNICRAYISGEYARMPNRVECV